MSAQQLDALCAAARAAVAQEIRASAAIAAAQTALDFYWLRKRLGVRAPGGVQRHPLEA